MLSKRFVQQHQGNQILTCVVINFYHHLVKLAKKFCYFLQCFFFYIVTDVWSDFSSSSNSLTIFCIMQTITCFSWVS